MGKGSGEYGISRGNLSSKGVGKRRAGLQEPALVNAKSTGYPIYGSDLNSKVARLRMTELVIGSEDVMKLRAAGAVGILLTCLLATTCNTQIPGSPSSSNQAKVRSAENTPPNPSSASPAAEARKKKPTPAAPVSGGRVASKKL